MPVVVVGAGLAGISAAYYLHQAGAEVIVLDRQPAPARETSYANGAMLTPSLADPWNSPGVFGQLLRNLGRADAAMLLRPAQMPRLLRWGIGFLYHSSRARFEASYLANAVLAQHSQVLLAELLAATGIDIEFRRGGILKVFEDASALRNAIEVAHWLKQVGVSHHVLDVEQLVQLEPALQPGAGRLAGAVHYPDDEVGNARLYCEGLAGWLADRGVEFRYSEQVLGFERSGRRIQAVKTPRGRIEAEAVLLAAGSFSSQLGRELAIRIPVAPAKGYSLTVHAPAVLPRYPVVDDALHAAVVPLGDRLRVAGTAEFAGFDARVREDRIDNLIRLLGRVYPQVPLEGLEIERWAGLRPMPADGRPLVGRAGWENLYLNTGHGALGWTHATGCGQMAAELVLGREPTMDATPFLASRSFWHSTS